MYIRYKVASINKLPVIMKNVIYTILFFPILLFSQVNKTYPNGKTKISFDTINQMIDGDFKYYYPNGNLKAKGKFYKNQKIGVWKFYTSDKKLLLKRTYLNNFIFNTKEDIPKLELNGYNYWHINGYDILYQDIFLTLLSKNTANKEFFENELFLKEIKKYALTENTEIYNDIEFTKRLKVNDLSFSIDSLKNINHFVLKETVFYDVEHQIMNRRILAIMPAEIKNNIIKPLFSIYEPDFRRFIKNDTILDKMFNNKYFGEVIKIYDKDSDSSKFKKMYSDFTNNNINWFDIKKPFDLEAFYLEKEINNNLRMKIEPELYINSSDSLNITNKKRHLLKYKFENK